MKREKWFLGVFVLVIVMIQSAFWFVPHQEVSEKEKRVLRTPPEVSLTRIADGRFMEQAEAYLMDHFPSREALVGVHAYLRQAEGLNAVGEIIRGQQDWLIAAPLADEHETLERNLSALQTFLDSTGKPSTALIVPTTGAVETDFLPHLHRPYPDEALLETIREGLPAKWCDVLGSFRTHDAPEQLFYRTDHHWTTMGAYTAYGLWCTETDRAQVPEAVYTKTKVPDFYGTSYAKSGLWATPPDTLEVWDMGIPVTVTVDDGKAPVTRDSLFFWSIRRKLTSIRFFWTGIMGVSQSRRGTRAADCWFCGIHSRIALHHS